MSRYMLLTLVMLLHTGADSATLLRSYDRESLCKCAGTYVRFGFEVGDNKKVIDTWVVTGTSDAVCDKLHIRSLHGYANHPSGVKGVGVVGYTFKDGSVDYDQCLDSKELEVDDYFFVEEIIIDVEEVNRRMRQ